MREARATHLEVAKLMNNASLCLLKDGNVDLALLAAEKAVATEPSLAKGHARRGEALLATERYRDAALAFAMALDRQESPEYAALHAKALELFATAG